MFMRKSLMLMLATALLCVACNESPVSPESEQGPYVWKSVQIVGGGFCDGIIFHPKAKDVRYARTDMGGAYRWDKEEGRWMPLLDFVSYADNNFIGVESIAVDPNDKNTVYLDCGTYTSSTDGAIFWSHDGGRTFGRTDVPFKMGGNENGRGNGERMMVDPNNSNIIYVGTRQAGLWRSTDKAQSFEQVASFQEVVERLKAETAEINGVPVPARLEEPGAEENSSGHLPDKRQGLCLCRSGRIPADGAEEFPVEIVFQLSGTEMLKAGVLQWRAI